MHRPGRADDRVEKRTVGRHIQKQSANAVNADRENAVNGKEIGRERDPGVGSIRENVSPLAAHMEAMDTSAKKHHPDGVGKFVTEHVEPLRTRQAEKSHQPQHNTQGEKPEFLGDPKPVMHGRACECGEESLREHPGRRQREKVQRSA